jgi:hypothetical protein
MTLRSSLLGAWDLGSYVENPVDGSPPRYPFGDDARGRLIYDQGGWMSVQLMVASRPSFASGDWFHATSDELSAAAAFIGYSGTFVIDESASTVSHVIDMSFFPNWIGQTQIRRISLVPNRLELTPVEPIRSDGRDVIPTLQWMRHEQAWSAA